MHLLTHYRKGLTVSPLDLMLYLLCAGVGITPALVLVAILVNLVANNITSHKAANR